MPNTVLDKTFRDDDGNLVIFQKPNLLVLVGIGASLLTLLPIEGNFYRGIATIAFGTLFAWAWLELFQGVNYFRRSLGLLVLLGLIVSRLEILG